MRPLFPDALFFRKLSVALILYKQSGKIRNNTNMSRDMTKTNQMAVRPAKTQISLGIRQV